MFSTVFRIYICFHDFHLNMFSNATCLERMYKTAFSFVFRIKTPNLQCIIFNISQFLAVGTYMSTCHFFSSNMVNLSTHSTSALNTLMLFLSLQAQRSIEFLNYFPWHKNFVSWIIWILNRHVHGASLWFRAPLQ